MVRRGIENLSFEDAIESEHERVHAVSERIRREEGYYSREFHFYTYLSRGIYIDQLKMWFDLFDRKQILIIRSEDLFSNPGAVYRKTTEFLGLEMWQPEHYTVCKQGQYGQMGSCTRNKLVEYFEAYNRQLANFLSMDLNWDC
jgi:hypothetical protein